MKAFSSDQLKTVNSATKYPETPTYHVRGDRGRLTEECVDFTGVSFVEVTEKVDGTNGRIVVFPDGDYLIGSREEFLYARGDRVESPNEQIVEALRPLADSGLLVAPRHGVTAYYLEVYGGVRTSKAARQYTGEGTLGARMFAVAGIEAGVLSRSAEEAALWRSRGGQCFWTRWEMELVANKFVDAPNGEVLGVVPEVARLCPEDLPVTTKAMADFMIRSFDVDERCSTLVALDGGAKGEPEGIVLSGAAEGGRRVVAKAKFADYRRLLEGPR